VCIGAYPQELKAYLNVAVPPHLRLLNILVWTYKNTLGPSPAYAYKQNWQALLYFAGVNAPRLDCPIMNEQFSVQEINAPDGRVGNHYHAWQKPDDLAERLIRHSTKAGDVVVDCFSGTGTFLLAAHRLGRLAFGCESDASMLDIAERRGCEVQR
jgi:DNA modification methylase